MQQSDQSNAPMRLRPTRLFKPQFIDIETLPREEEQKGSSVATLSTTILPPSPSSTVRDWGQDINEDDEYDPDAEILLEDLDIGSMSTMRLMQISSTMRAVHPPQHGVSTTIEEGHSQKAHYDDLTAKAHLQPTEVASQPKQQKKGRMAVRYAVGLTVGIGFLLLVSRFINIASTLVILQHSLTTTQGILNALGAAGAFIAAFSIRGIRWSLFLRPIKRVSPFKTIRIFWIAVFMNFILPVQGGEVIKTFLLKRTDGIPISRSLPTVAIDKSLDLMPALFLIAVMPFIPGLHMTLPLWLILIFVSSILLGVLFTVVLTAWNRSKAIKFVGLFVKLLPKGIGAKIESFAFGFIDSLLEGASRPKTFIPAILLTCVALSCDGLFAWMCFRVVGITNMSYGTAIFGYTLFNMFVILPSPPGQLGSNETYGPLVFNQLLGFDKTHVLAMFLFSHPLAALIMTTMCFTCLGTLGFSLASVMKSSPDESAKNASSQQRTPSQALQYGRV